jgi:xanthine dehydrogenase YagR molybdenum-binding subunit
MAGASTDMPGIGDLELNRRDLMVGGSTLAALTVVPSAMRAQPAPAGAPVVSKVPLIDNGQARDLEIDTRITLLDALREHMHLTGSKKGCDPAAEMMGVTIDKMVVRLGNSAFPVAAGSGGQWGANSPTAGVHAACVKLHESVSQRLGFNAAGAVFVEGEVRSDNRRAALAQAAETGELVAEDTIEYGDLEKTHQQSTFAAHFVEVGVDAATAETRVRRMLAVCAAGCILNPKTARSQVIGAMTMGVGGALTEELAVDTRRVLFVNHNLVGYEIPVHADIPHQEVIFLDEVDPMSSPMKAKGVGELGLSGVGAAVANSVYNATGSRVRNYPLTLDKLITQLPDVA